MKKRNKMNVAVGKTILLLVLMQILYHCPLAGQYYNQKENFLKANSVWAFGYNTGLDFSKGTPVPLQTAIRSIESAASISDTNGHLLFYTDGMTVWNRNHDTMLNGAKLFANFRTSSLQGVAIVPVIDTPGKYYIFSTAEIDIYLYWASGSFSHPSLAYSIVDMTLDSGLGGVEPGRKCLPLYNYGLLEPIIAIPGDNCDIWLVGVSKRSPYMAADPNLPLNVHYFVAWRITRHGIDSNPIYSNPGFDDPNRDIVSGLAVSPDRENIAFTHIFFGVGLCRFNVATGIVSDGLKLVPDNTNTRFYGICFSPDNKKMYVTGDNLLQYDIAVRDETTIRASKYIVAKGLATCSILKLYKDTIYGVSVSKDNMYRINSPNASGAACNLEENVISLSQRLPGYGYGLPNDVVLPLDPIEIADVAQVVDLHCSDSSIILSATNLYGSGYVWNDGVEGSSRQVVHAGTWWVRYRMSTCVYSTDTFHVLPPDYPTLHILPACRQEANGMAYFRSFSGDTTYFTYNWYSEIGQFLSGSDTLQRLSSGNYSVSVSSGYCDTVVHFHIPSEDYRVSFESDSTSCEGLELAFDNTSDAHFTVWNWSFGEGSGSSQESPVHVYHRSGSYVVKLVGHGPVCSDTTDRMVIVDAPVEGIFFSVDRDNICVGERILFTPHVDFGALSLYWNPNTGILFPAANEPMWYSYDVEGRHHALLRARFRSCPDLIYTDTIEVHASPLVDLGPDTVICLGSAAVLLRNHRVSNADHLQYEWNTGDTSATLAVFQPGYYSLRISNSHGCVGSEGVRVYKDCHMDVPNVFTPNGDGVNDYFFPRQLLTSSVRSFRMHIFNRWGQVVFETDHAEGQGWDGKFNDRPQPSGVYVYLLEVIFDNGRQEQYRGNVSLLR